LIEKLTGVKIDFIPDSVVLGLNNI